MWFGKSFLGLATEGMSSEIQSILSGWATS